MNTFDVGALDLAKQRNDEPARVILRRGDKNATTITATITDHGDPADTTGLSARFSMRLPDMAHYYSKAATLDGNAVSITINEEQAASTVGKTSIAFFELLDASGNLIASTSAFDVIVLMGATDGTGIGESYSDELEEAMQQLADAREDYEEMREGAGEAIDAANAAASTATAAASSATSAAANANQAASDIRAAAARGDFDGFSPVVDIDDGASSHTITITDREGDHSYTVPTYAAEESARAAAEQARATAESTRATAETARATAESARATAETTRATAEQSRATAETARASAESVRVTAEQGRASAENARASAESARVTAESARASAETSRTTAESARATAESIRATEWATVKAEAEDATSAAETATSDAQDAADDATAAAAEARAASAATWLSGNVLFGELAEGAVLTADDTYAAPPKGVEVYGKSTQAGTPTPDAPVEIESVDDLTLWLCGKNLLDYEAFKDIANWDTSALYMAFPISVPSGVSLVAHYDGTAIASSDVTMDFLAAKGSSASNYLIHANYPNTTRTVATTNGVVYLNAYPKTQATIDTILELLNGRYLRVELGTATAYTPYVGQSVEIPLDNNVGRSLPDGTRDTLTLSYVGPSTEHEGWGVFGASLVQRLDESDLGDFTWTAYTISGNQIFRAPKIAVTNQSLCTALTHVTNGPTTMPDNSINSLSQYWNTNGHVAARADAYANATAFKSAMTGQKLVYQLITPVTHDLGTVELPVNPAPDLTAWADGGSAQPTLSMTYEQDINIVIARIEAAISDLATS